MTRALLRQVRDTTLRTWRITSDGVLLRVAGDWYQALALQRDKHRRGWFPNAWVTCLAIHDGAVLCDQRIVTSAGQLWTNEELRTLGDAFTAQARPEPLKPLSPTAILRSLSEIERRSLAPPGPFDDGADPRVLLALAVCAVRDGDATAACAAVKRALRSPGSGGLSSTWSVTEWAKDLARHLELGREDAARFLDQTRESSLEDLGRLE